MKKKSKLPTEKTTGGGPPSPYSKALEFAIRKELGADIARKLLRNAFWQSIAQLVTLLIIGVMAIALINQPREYFATEKGRLTTMVPLQEPGWSQADVIAFGEDTLREAFSLNFVQFRQQMSRVEPRFSGDGYVAYNQALSRSNILSNVRDRRMNLAPGISPGVVRRRGVNQQGHYSWEIQYPVTLQLMGQNTNLPEQRFIFQIMIQRADVSEKPHGLEVAQLISTNA